MKRPSASLTQQYLLAALRIVAGFAFSLHGFQKMFGVLGGRVAPMLSLSWVAGILEIAGGLLILFGLFTRPVAFILSGQMAVAYFLRHAPRGFFPVANGGELAALYCFIFLYLAAAGSGALSLDAILRRR